MPKKEQGGLEIHFLCGRIEGVTMSCDFSGTVECYWNVLVLGADVADLCKKGVRCGSVSAVK